MKKSKEWLKYCSISKAWQRAYIFEVTRGICLTSYKTVKNLLLHPIKALRISKKEWSDLVVVQYPDEKRHYAERYRGRHRLVIAENGKVKCQACYLCATNCPAHCIHIEAAESELHEKYPKRFEIDTLRCIYCGMCVEACPVDAIRMDTGIHPKVYPPDVSQYVEDKEILVQRSLDLLSGTKSELYDKHRHSLQQMERDRSVNPFLKVNEK